MPKPTHDSKFVNEEGEKLRRNGKFWGGMEINCISDSKVCLYGKTNCRASSVPKQQTGP